MRYVVEVPNFGEFAAPRVFAEVARRAEESGWDALPWGDDLGRAEPVLRRIEPGPPRV
jgi:hypothetical protein